jgi:hypothetical protein
MLSLALALVIAVAMAVYIVNNNDRYNTDADDTLGNNSSEEQVGINDE